MVSLVNAERVSVAFGTRTLLDGVSLGLSRGDVIGVVGRNGDGKTTLLRLLTGTAEPDSGRVTQTGHVSIGYLRQSDDTPPGTTVRTVIVDGAPDHVWAADARTRAVVEHLLGSGESGIDLDAPLTSLSGGERRRVALVELLLGEHDLLVLDEPTNHLDVEAVAWLADALNDLQARSVAMLVVSHDRWFLDAICTRIWEVHDARVDAYDGGYAAYVLARAERARQAGAAEAKRQNLVREELAWLRRGPPARTSKPQFRIDAANALIADEPPARDRMELQRFATTRLGKDVFDLRHVDLRVGDRVLLDDLTWSIGPGDRIGLVGVNGAGKTSLLRLLDGGLTPTAGTVRSGRTLNLAHLGQTLTQVSGTERVLDAVEGVRRQVRVATGAEVSASSLLEGFGFTGARLTTRLDDLSGGERRRLQLLRLLLAEPNVLLLDEPTNDLDIDTLTVVEDYLDGWPGTLVVVSHDRYFLERVCDVTYALLGDGSCVLLPGGVEQYLELRRTRRADGHVVSSTAAPAPSANADLRLARKTMARAESQIERVERRIAALHEQMAAAASDHTRLLALQRDLDAADAEKDDLEAVWLEAAELVG